jgi:hypothetical protein
MSVHHHKVPRIIKKYLQYNNMALRDMKNVPDKQADAITIHIHNSVQFYIGGKSTFLQNFVEFFFRENSNQASMTSAYELVAT